MKMKTTRQQSKKPKRRLRFLLCLSFYPMTFIAKLWTSCQITPRSMRRNLWLQNSFSSLSRSAILWKRKTRLEPVFVLTLGLRAHAVFGFSGRGGEFIFWELLLFISLFSAFPLNPYPSRSGLGQRPQELGVRDLVPEGPSPQWRIEQLHAKIQELMSQKDQLNPQVISLQAQVREHEDSRAALNTEIESWRAYLTLMDRFLERSHGQFAALSDVISFLYDDQDIPKCLNAARNVIRGFWLAFFKSF